MEAQREGERERKIDFNVLFKVQQPIKTVRFMHHMMDCHSNRKWGLLVINNKIIRSDWLFLDSTTSQVTDGEKFFLFMIQFLHFYFF